MDNVQCPLEWSSDWLASSPQGPPDFDNEDIPLHHPLNFIPHLGHISYELEHSFNYFGTPIPLIYQDDEAYDVRTLFKAGGLVFVMTEVPLVAFMVVPPGTTVEEAAAVLEDDTDGFPFPSVSKCMGAYCIQPKAIMKWGSEPKKLGRNRRAELKDRGGEVHADRLVTTLKDRKAFPASWR